MFQFQLAYRHGDGSVEGFVGTGHTSENARRNAVAKAKDKAGYTPEPFNPDRVIYGPKGLTNTEREQICADWQISACSATI